MHVGVVCEGPTDFLVLRTAIDAMCPGRHRYLQIQPKSSAAFDEMGTGWKGVRRWCQQVQPNQERPGSSLATFLDALVDPAIDLLVIHLDADVILEDDLQEGQEDPVADLVQPCPPIAALVDRLRCVVLRWLDCDGPPGPPGQLLLVVPSQDTENWTFAALYPNDPLCKADDYECLHPKNGRMHPGYLLTRREYGQVLAFKDGTVKKSKAKYRRLLPALAQNWGAVCRICGQAEEFAQQLIFRGLCAG